MRDGIEQLGGIYLLQQNLGISCLLESVEMLIHALEPLIRNLYGLLSGFRNDPDKFTGCQIYVLAVQGDAAGLEVQRQLCCVAVGQLGDMLTGGTVGLKLKGQLGLLGGNGLEQILRVLSSQKHVGKTGNRKLFCFSVIASQDKHGDPVNGLAAPHLTFQCELNLGGTRVDLPGDIGLVGTVYEHLPELLRAQVPEVCSEEMRESDLQVRIVVDLSDGGLEPLHSLIPVPAHIQIPVGLGLNLARQCRLIIRVLLGKLLPDRRLVGAAATAAEEEGREDLPDDP